MCTYLNGGRHYYRVVGVVISLWIFYDYFFIHILMPPSKSLISLLNHKQLTMLTIKFKCSITDRDQVQLFLGSYKQCVPILCLICLCIILI